MFPPRIRSFSAEGIGRFSTNDFAPMGWLVGLSAPWRILSELEEWMYHSGATSLQSLA